MAKFGDLPLALQHDLREEFWPLTYDREARLFSIGDYQHPIVEPDLISELTYPRGSGIISANLPSVPIAIDELSNPIGTPKFYKWLVECDQKTEFAQTEEVIADAISVVRNQDVRVNKIKLTPFEVSCGLQREGQVILRTIGNCACLGPRVGGLFVDYHEWDTGYAEYELHNIDFSEQIISLMAGLGHLATRCLSQTQQ